MSYLRMLMAVFSLVILASNRPAYAAPELCKKLLTTGQAVWEYGKATAIDFAQHPFVRPYSAPETEPPFRVLSTSSYFHHFVNRPVGLLTQKLFGKSYVPGCIPNLVIGMVAASCAWESTWKAIDETTFRLDQPELVMTLHEDFRYFDIDTAVQEKKMSEDAALRAVYIRRSNLKLYYLNLRMHPEQSPFFDEQNRFTFIYKDMFGVLANGVPDHVDGFTIPNEAKGELSPEKKRELIHLQDNLYIGYQTISVYFRTGPSNNMDGNAQTALAAMNDLFERDPNIIAIRHDLEKGKITPGYATKKVQEYFFWLITNAKYRVMGISKNTSE